MPFALLTIGAVMLIVAVKGTQSDLATLVKKDFTGPASDNFLYWIVAIFVIGMVGYVEKLKPLSTAFLGLVIVVLFLRKGKGFFPQLLSGLASTQSVQPAAGAPSGTQNSSIMNLPGLQSLATQLVQ
jgi:hypothetical protein